MEGLTSAEHGAVARVADAPMLANTLDWSAINSGTGNLAGLREVAAWLADAFSVLPGELRLVDPAAAERVDAAGRVVAVDHGRHLHLRVRPEAPAQLLFTGHMDTVYPSDHPFQAVTRRNDGTVNGPGVADMKGGLALLLAALTAVEASPLAARFGYEVVVNSDEETGSFSSAALLAEAACGKVAALTYEPALPDGTLAGARGGTGNFSVVIRGRSAHAGRNPEEGRNAVVAAAHFAVRLANEQFGSMTVNPAKIDGGGPNNVVPDLAVLRVNFRPRTLAAIEGAKRFIEEVKAEVVDAYDVRVEVHGSFNRPPKPIDAGTARLFDVVKRAGGDLGLAIAWRDTGGVCDGNNIAAARVPVVDTMGARGGAIHSADEYLIVDSLAERAALSAVTILRIVEGGL